MGDNTAIEWADATWNPIVGCSILTSGCARCYAMGEAARQVRMAEGAGRVSAYAGLTTETKAGPVWNGRVRLRHDALDLPLRWRKPRRIFVNSMGDLFHEDVPDAWIDHVFATMALAPHHTLLVLTKRAGRMRHYMAAQDRRRSDALGRLVLSLGYRGPLEALRWPLPNVQLGVSAEDQATFDQRWPELAVTPAALRWFSFEPLLGPIDPAKAFATGRFGWAVAGGESGPRARPAHPSWARALRDESAAAGIPFLFKQWGEWSPSADHWPCPNQARDQMAVHVDGSQEWRPLEVLGLTMTPGWAGMCRLGKVRAGRLLDGVLHDAYPNALPQGDAA